ncbi:penicillin-binding protein, 1A family [Roseovarius nanhaiticus]|uniref:peptidoglycan glycosyltransferase n=1 Tax=Roseovarius nanhaiticus TaxID=573024 RepID=A0A1N7F0Z0_9RHOB|nr:PBP1A family penicillin-binding protein [Roseovarius nanhaiticus]SEK63451.1 penicillin-binding protein, 1A family [Roseovarius nanhaiticus]SIR93944.1 penicillin-binding protein, 1A family [Roseovarius nanhaiticus]
MSTSGPRKPPLVADRRKPKTKPKPAAKPRKTRARKAPRPPRGGNVVTRAIFGLLSLVWRVVWGIGWRLGAIALIIVGIAVGYVYTTLPEASALLDGRARGSVTLLDRDSDVFAWRGDQFGGAVNAGAVSSHLRNAVIATEDRRFYLHPGIDPIGIASAIRINLSEGRGPLSGHGGSTLTQQTAKLLCLGNEYVEAEWESQAAYEADCRRGSLARKGKEAIYALAMEAKYTKEEILSIYLNRAYMGGGAYGAEAASQRYFGKSAAQLNPAEGAMLAGLLTAPSTLAPTSNIARSQNRAATVVRLMREQDYLTDSEAALALATPAELSEAAERQAGGYFADWVMSSGPEFFTRDTTEDVIIRTTLDQRIQRAAEQGLHAVLDEKLRDGSKAQAAVVVMSADGAVRAMVGGRQTKVSGAFNRATQANRQTGSSFKPFVYATALELGYSSLDTVVDERYCLNIAGSGEWCPSNYTNRFHGRVTLAKALEQSYNIPAVKVAESVGLDLVRKVASDFGIESDLAAGPALALGASESTLLEMTGAFAGILNGGSSVTPYGLVELKLLGQDEAVMGAGGGIGERVIREEAARELTWMMSRVVESGTGARAKLPGREAAGKTGTTQAARDAWFLGFTADYVAGVWMGYDDNTPLTGVTGGGLPAEIWHEVMTRVHEGMPATPLPMTQPTPPAPQVSQGQTYGGQSYQGQGGQGYQGDQGTQTDRGWQGNPVPAPRDNREGPITNILRRLLGG